MDDIDLSQIILLLTSCTQRARDAFQLPRNRRFCFSPVSTTSSTSERTPEVIPDKRETTPAIDYGESSIALTLRDEGKPFDPQKGFTFGSNHSSDEIDILLDTEGGESGVSRLHFSINFNWDTGVPMLRNWSNNGTILESRAFGSKLLRRGEIAPLSTEDNIKAGLVMLQVSIPDRVANELAYMKSWRAYRAEVEAATPSINGLRIVEPAPVTVSHPTELTEVKVIGAGTSGTVYKAMDVAGRYYAVKVFKTGRDPAEKEKIDREIEILSQLNHRNIIHLVQSKTFGRRGQQRALGSPYIVMEFAEHGTLDDYPILTRCEVRLAFNQIFDAVYYIHEQDLCHRDLKPTNILVKELMPMKVQVADLGFAKLDLGGTLKTFLGTYLYCAPEIWKEQPPEPYTTKCDIWSLGVMLLHRSIQGGCPNCSIDPGAGDRESCKKATSLVESRKAYGVAKVGYKGLRDLATRMLDYSPDRRPDAEDCSMLLSEMVSSAPLTVPNGERTGILLSALVKHFSTGSRESKAIGRMEKLEKGGKYYIALDGNVSTLLGHGPMRTIVEEAKREMFLRELL